MSAATHPPWAETLFFSKSISTFLIFLRSRIVSLNLSTIPSKLTNYKSTGGWSSIMAMSTRRNDHPQVPFLNILQGSSDIFVGLAEYDDSLKDSQWPNAEAQKSGTYLTASWIQALFHLSIAARYISSGASPPRITSPFTAALNSWIAVFGRSCCLRLRILIFWALEPIFADWHWNVMELISGVFVFCIPYHASSIWAEDMTHSKSVCRSFVFHCSETSNWVSKGVC